MVQSKMGLAPYQSMNYEYVDAVPTEHKIKKKIEVNGEWVDRTFIRIPLSISHERYGTESEIEKWCRQHYTGPRYLGLWFKVSGHIVLDEKVYTHWKLCE